MRVDFFHLLFSVDASRLALFMFESRINAVLVPSLLLRRRLVPEPRVLHRGFQAGDKKSLRLFSGADDEH